MSNTQAALRKALEEIISLAPAGSLCQNKAKDLLASTVEPEQTVAWKRVDTEDLTCNPNAVALAPSQWKAWVYASPQVREQPAIPDERNKALRDAMSACAMEMYACAGTPDGETQIHNAAVERCRTAIRILIAAPSPENKQ